MSQDWLQPCPSELFPQLKTHLDRGLSVAQRGLSFDHEINDILCRRFICQAALTKGTSISSATAAAAVVSALPPRLWICAHTSSVFVFQGEMPGLQVISTRSAAACIDVVLSAHVQQKQPCVIKHEIELLLFLCVILKT